MDKVFTPTSEANKNSSGGADSPLGIPKVDNYFFKICHKFLSQQRIKVMTKETRACACELVNNGSINKIFLK